MYVRRVYDAVVFGTRKIAGLRSFSPCIECTSVGTTSHPTLPPLPSICARRSSNFILFHSERGYTHTMHGQGTPTEDTADNVAIECRRGYASVR